MKRKHLLNVLKQQVREVQKQLNVYEKPKKNKHNVSKNSSCSHSSSYQERFFSMSNPRLSLNSTDKGVKKFVEKGSHFRNITQLINNKSVEPQKPRMSEYRKAENMKTKQNFTTVSQVRPSKSRDPNPITGEGYNGKNSLSSIKLWAATLMAERKIRS